MSTDRVLVDEILCAFFSSCLPSLPSPKTCVFFFSFSTEAWETQTKLFFSCPETKTCVFFLSAKFSRRFCVFVFFRSYLPNIRRDQNQCVFCLSRQNRCFGRCLPKHNACFLVLVYQIFETAFIAYVNSSKTLACFSCLSKPSRQERRLRFFPPLSFNKIRWD